jgi:two-component system response regulator GlrR
MQDIHTINPELPIIILTGHGTIESAVEAMKKGACAFVTKPFDFDELFIQIRKCLIERDPSKEVKRSQTIEVQEGGLKNLIGKNRGMKKVLEQVVKAAESDSIVYINGESGTGKELIAQKLHRASSRKDGPFVAVNCAAIPETLLESELFGYEKGAFTGADRKKKGLFAQAHTGTFFLDEISEMPLSMQAKLLRVLEDKKIYPLGGSGKPLKVDARILAASNKHLLGEVDKGNFREDLFYRIHVISINIPPLRERKEDIPLLANHFLMKFSDMMNKKITGFSPVGMRKLISHDWPGNVRELENAVEAAVTMADQDIINDVVILSTRQSPQGGLKSLKDAKEDFEKDYLIHLIELTQGNMTRASKLAGKYRSDLYALLKKYNLNPADFRKKKEPSG